MGKVVGEPYRGKPDVRFDEGAKETCRGKERHRCKTKVAGNSYFPCLKCSTEARLYWVFEPKRY
jgi:hypothetical protein